MSAVLKRNFLLSFLNDFLLLFSFFYVMTFALSFLRYSAGYGVVDIDLAIAFCLFVFPFVIIFSFSTSLFFFLKQNLGRVVFLEVFGKAGKSIFELFFAVSLLIFSASLLFFFYVSPRSFLFMKIESVKSLPIKFSKEIKKYVLTMGDKLFVAERIMSQSGKLKMYDGFVFDGENLMNFKEAEISIEKGKSKLIKDLAELIEEGGREELNEVMFDISFSLSSVTCLPFSFQIFKFGIICTPIFFFISKFFRDTLNPLSFAILSLLIHTLSFFIGLKILKKNGFL
ncbi:hypothetical protein HRbin19_00105 [bacterium HR19]|nr:hypothetical protein HRbin19_00105 [bacterium HR19]